MLDLGNDTIDGGAGIDTLDASADTDFVVVDLSITAAQNTRQGIDTISNVENLIGSGFNDTLRGDTGVNVINGGAGIDNITGNGGADSLFGEDGDDNFFIGGNEAAGDLIDGGADSDDIILTSDTFLDFTTTFTSI